MPIPPTRSIPCLLNHTCTLPNLMQWPYARELTRSRCRWTDAAALRPSPPQLFLILSCIPVRTSLHPARAYTRHDFDRDQVALPAPGEDPKAYVPVVSLAVPNDIHGGYCPQVSRECGGCIARDRGLKSRGTNSTTDFGWVGGRRCAVNSLSGDSCGSLVLSATCV